MKKYIRTVNIFDNFTKIMIEHVISVEIFYGLFKFFYRIKGI